MAVPIYEETTRIRNLTTEYTQFPSGAVMAVDSIIGTGKMDIPHLFANNLMVDDNGLFYVYVDDGED